jgi:hypothetical protein
MHKAQRVRIYAQCPHGFLKRHYPYGFLKRHDPYGFLKRHDPTLEQNLGYFNYAQGRKGQSLCYFNYAQGATLVRACAQCTHGVLKSHYPYGFLKRHYSTLEQSLRYFNYAQGRKGQSLCTMHNYGVEALNVLNFPDLFNLEKVN